MRDPVRWSKRPIRTPRIRCSPATYPSGYQQGLSIHTGCIDIHTQHTSPDFRRDPISGTRSYHPSRRPPQERATLDLRPDNASYDNRLLTPSQPHSARAGNSASSWCGLTACPPCCRRTGPSLRSSRSHSARMAYGWDRPVPAACQRDGPLATSIGGRVCLSVHPRGSAPR